MKNIIRVLTAFASLALTSALFAAGSVDISISSGETIQIDLYGTGDSSVQLIDLNTNQVVADGGMLTGSSGNYTNNYYGSGNSYVSGVTFSIGSSSYITGLPAGNYRLAVSTSGCTGWGGGSHPYYYISDWGTWDSMDYTITVY